VSSFSSFCCCVDCLNKFVVCSNWFGINWSSRSDHIDLHPSTPDTVMPGLDPITISRIGASYGMFIPCSFRFMMMK
jgi:hypothetical protein